MLSRYLGKDPDTPTYMEALSGRNIYHMRHFEGQQEYSTAFLSLGCIKWNIDDGSSIVYMINDGIMIEMWIWMRYYC